MMTRCGAASDPNGIKCRGDSVSKSSQGETHPYHASVDAAQAMTGNGFCLYNVSQSNTRQSSVGYGTRALVPSLEYLVHPLCLTHSVGGLGRSTLAKVVAIERYGSAESIPI